MSLLLHLETSTTNCSVALAENDRVIGHRALNEGYSHAENLHRFMAELLQSVGCKPTDLSALCVSKGPGSYTGLRIGVSAAKGLAFALNMPLISLETLKVMCAGIDRSVLHPESVLYPLLDARRMEVYTAAYDLELKRITNTEALIVEEDTLAYFNKTKPVFFGEGMPKCRSVLTGIREAVFIDGIVPDAAQMAVLGWEKFLRKEFEDLAYFEPVYLKEFMVKRKGA